MQTNSPPSTINTKRNIREQVYSLLRSRMRSGEIKFKDRLVDHEIAAELHVSRMPVREALLQLKNEGLVDGTSRGFVLRQFTPTDIAQLFEIRILLEPEAAVSACKNATLEGLASMNLYTQAAEKAHLEDSALEYMQANDNFRYTWLNMSTNPHLRSMIFRLSDHVETVRLATLRESQYRALSLDSTQRLLQAFLEENIEQVQQAVRFNLRHAALSYYATLDGLLDKNESEHNKN